MAYKLKSRAQEFCDRSNHTFELTIDGHLMAKGKDGKWRSVFDGTNEPDDPQLDAFFLKEEE